MIGWRNTVRVVAGKDPVMPCGAERPHAPHAFPIYSKEGKSPVVKRYFFCEGVK